MFLLDCRKYSAYKDNNNYYYDDHKFPLHFIVKTLRLRQF